jgi:DNA-binding SARP family transcriptional activator
MANMWFTAMGPVQVWRDGAEVDLGAPQQRAVLAVLVVRAGRPVSLAEIIDTLWWEAPPATAANAVHRSVGLLRRALEPGLTARSAGRWLVRAGGGYRLDAGEGAVDVLRFRLLIDRARSVAATDAPAALALCAEALQLWQGPAAATLTAEVRGRPVFTALDRECEAAAGEAADVALTAGHPGRLLGAVEVAAGRAPLNESLQARLMLMLAATGQQAAALRQYAQVRARLAEDLGVGPGPELVAAEERVRHPETSFASPAYGGGQVAQLPRDLPAFTGRGPELAAAHALLDGAAVVPVGAICGLAGVGKTTFAVHLAHQVADRCPDGQLHVDLRGFGPGPMLEPAEALGRLLEALDVPPHRIPAGLDARAALYRSRLAGRRMLVLLDNARDTAQVRPLLPGAPGCLVLVTSRDRLAGLIVSDGARPITLGMLSVDESRRLLTGRLGAARVGAEPRAVDEVISRCGGLALALAVVAARAAMNPRLSMAELAAGDRWDVLTTGEPDTDVRTVFSWSYRLLADGPARMFRLLGRHPGTDIAVPAAAGLAGLDQDRVRPLLAELVRRGLLTEIGPGRYATHDLLRAYAADLVHASETDDSRQAAQARLVDHHLRTERAGTGSASSVHIMPTLCPLRCS